MRQAPGSRRPDETIGHCHKSDRYEPNHPDRSMVRGGFKVTAVLLPRCFVSLDL